MLESRERATYTVPKPAGITKWRGSEELQTCISKSLPDNYNFEVPKTLARIEDAKAKSVVLQFPEGLLVWADALAAIIDTFLGVEVVIMGDVTYGACCIDDILVQSLGGDFLIHYGHSCLIPLVETVLIQTLYVFVDIYFDTGHIKNVIKSNFDPKDSSKLALLGVVQYISVLLEVQEELNPAYKAGGGYITIPQMLPLSQGEVLGCTSPVLAGTSKAVESSGCQCNTKATCSAEGNKGVRDIEELTPATVADDISGVDAVIFIADGRFHIESAMIQNPHIPFYRYDPFKKVLVRECYDHLLMKHNRKEQIMIVAEILNNCNTERSKESNTNTPPKVALIISTLGRQGSIGIAEELVSEYHKAGAFVIPCLVSEFLPSLAHELKDDGVDFCVQVACPRLSLDWGTFYPFPVLNSYEAKVSLGLVDFREVYPMDYYSNEGGPWSNRGVPSGRMGTQKARYRNIVIDDSDLSIRERIRLKQISKQ